MAALQDSQGGTSYACLRCGTIGTVPVKEGRDRKPPVEPESQPERVEPELGPTPPSPPPQPQPQPAPPPEDCPPPPPPPPPPREEPPPWWQHLSDRRSAQPTGRTPDLATAAMVCGLLGVIPCCGAIVGLLGVVLGVTALSRNLPRRERAVIGIIAGLLAPALSMALGWLLLGA